MSRVGNKRVNHDLRWLVGYFFYLLVVWTLVRYSVKFSDIIEELWLKPVLWLFPLFWLRIRGRITVNMFAGNRTNALVVGVLMAVAYIVMNASVFIARGGNIFDVFRIDMLNNIGIGFATAVTEEIVFSGIIFASLYGKFKKPILALILSTLMFGAIHIPIGVFVYDYNLIQMGYFLMSAMLVGAVNQYLFYLTGNVSTSIVSHWGWVVATSIFR